MCALAVVAVLASIGIAGWKPMMARAEGAKCLSHMRALHSSFASYIQDVGHWPQEPGVEDEDFEIDAAWWLKEMQPYGSSPDVWMCPSLKRVQLADPESERWLVHYIPTIFGPEPTAAYKFARQPWFVEAAGMHGRGPNICFPDGSIQPLDDLLPAK